MRLTTLPRKIFIRATETFTRESSAGKKMDVTQETGKRTEVSEIREEDAILRTDILRTKTSHRVGCWNVRTLYKTGKLAHVVIDMDSYKIQLLVLGVSETRWTKAGKCS